MTDFAYLLDTNAAIALLKDDPEINEVLKGATMFISSIALGELYFGAEKSGRVTENVQRVDEFASERAILNCDAETARIYGEIYNRLRAKGRPIPQNDVWIAAIALQHSLTLLTRDEHFQQVEDLPQASW